MVTKTPSAPDSEKPKKLRGRGSGRPRGRPLGSKGKKTIYREKLDSLKDAQAAYEAQIASIDEHGVKRDKYGNVLGDFYGETPLEFMLAVMHDAKAPTAFRFQAAKESAPYRHPKLASIEVKSKNVNVDVSKDHKGQDLTPEQASKVYKDLLDG